MCTYNNGLLHTSACIIDTMGVRFSLLMLFFRKKSQSEIAIWASFIVRSYCTEERLTLYLLSVHPDLLLTYSDTA